MKPNSRGLVDHPILTLSHRPRCLKLPLLYTPCFYRRRPASHFHHPPAPSLWCPILAVTYRKHHEFSISLETLACMLGS